MIKLIKKYSFCRVEQFMVRCAELQYTVSRSVVPLGEESKRVQQLSGVGFRSHSAE